jgi:hypothetical protein
MDLNGGNSDNDIDSESNNGLQPKRSCLSERSAGMVNWTTKKYEEESTMMLRLEWEEVLRRWFAVSDLRKVGRIWRFWAFAEKMERARQHVCKHGCLRSGQARKLCTKWMEQRDQDMPIAETEDSLWPIRGKAPYL